VPAVAVFAIESEPVADADRAANRADVGYAEAVSSASPLSLAPSASRGALDPGADRGPY
jgi:hypothetical protein